MTTTATINILSVIYNIIILAICFIESLVSSFKGQIATVDSFQGGEKRVIEKFSECPLRVNVALTRAKHALVIVRNFPHFRERSGSLWSKILQLAQS